MNPFDKNELISRLFEDAGKTQIQCNSYIRSYPHLISFFSSLPSINEEQFVVAALMTYGWMPRTLNFRQGSFAQGARLLTKMSDTDAGVDFDDLVSLKNIVNNSLVGTSKLLHFVNPSRFAIWDKYVHYYIHRSNSYHSLKKIENYTAYLVSLKEVTSSDKFTEVHKIIQSQISYSITRMRSAELIMFLNGKSELKNPSGSSRVRR